MGCSRWCFYRCLDSQRSSGTVVERQAFAAESHSRDFVNWAALPVHSAAECYFFRFFDIVLAFVPLPFIKE